MLLLFYLFEFYSHTNSSSNGSLSTHTFKINVSSAIILISTHLAIRSANKIAMYGADALTYLGIPMKDQICAYNPFILKQLEVNMLNSTMLYYSHRGSN